MTKQESQSITTSLQEHESMDLSEELTNIYGNKIEFNQRGFVLNIRRFKLNVIETSDRNNNIIRKPFEIIE